MKAKNKTTGEIREWNKVIDYFGLNNDGYKAEFIPMGFIILSKEQFLSEWEVIDEPKYEEAQMKYIGYEDTKTGKFHTPSSSLEDKIKSELAVFWDKIAENLPKSFERSALGDEKIFIAFNAVYPEIRNYLVSLNKQQLLQEYDNLKGSKFRMGYEAGRREVLELAVKQTIAQFLQMNIENPKAPVNIDEVKRRAITNLNNK